MKITILGTGAPESMPVLFDSNKSVSRLRPSLLVEHKDISLLFDASPDIRQQLLQSNATHLDAVFVTHHHFDHFWGIADLDQLHWVGKDTFKIYCPLSCKNNVDEHMSWLSLDFLVIKKSIIIGDVKVTPFEIKHSEYLDMFGFVIDCDNKRVVYAPDLKNIEENELKKALNADLLVVDGQYILGKYIKDDDHAGGKELQNLIDSFEANKIWLIAYSEYWYKMSSKEAETKLDRKYIIPNDFDSLEF